MPEADTLSKSEMMSLEETVTIFRQSLYDISWLIRNLNDYKAREANKEDNCTGRFWEGRFKSQALLDDNALLPCMAYVDLNPIRAKINKTPETSKHTSIHNVSSQSLKASNQKNLIPFVGNPRQNMPKGIAYSPVDYCELVDSTGRCIREDKAGYIEHHHNPILERLSISAE